MNVNGRLTFENLTADPTSPAPSEGDMYYNSTTKSLVLYDGSDWNGVGGAGGFDWTWVEDMTYAGETTKTTATLPVYDEYMMLFTGITGGADTYVRVNGITGSDYFFLFFDGGGMYEQTNVHWRTGRASSTASIYGRLMIQGHSPDQSNAKIGCRGMVMGAMGSQDFLSGNVTIGQDTQVSTLTYYSGSAMTGTVRVYGRNF